VTDDNAIALPSTTAKVASYPSLGRVGAVVDDRIRKWQYGLLSGAPQLRAHSVAVLARLRRGVGKPAGSVADILSFTLADEFAGRDAPDGPTAAEIAAHIAMTLYAVHQQSQDKPMHQRGQGLGRAIRRLHPEEPGSPPAPVVRRFQALVTSESLDELTHHARGMVQLLRAGKPGGFSLDYGLLADQLLRWQRPGEPSKVRMIWAREFYRTQRLTKSADSTSPDDADDLSASAVATSSSPEGN
jgi:CRISPR system Cascade subunit CasB